MKIKETQVAPEWFGGEIYTEGMIVENPFSKEEYELNNVELSIYDFILGAQMMIETMPKMAPKQMSKDFRKALDWFRKNNTEAYFALLD